MQNKIIWTMVVSLLIAVTGAAAVIGGPVSEYDALYTLTTGNNTVTQKMYFKDAQKFRLEMNTKQGDVKVITRLDKNISWVLLDEQKMYMEQQIDSEAIKQYQCNQDKAKKVGTEKVLNFNCDVYEYVDGKQTYKYWLVQNVMAIARTIMLKDGKEEFRMEAKEINIRKQADSLFELPSGYQKFSFNLKLPKN